MSRSGSLSVIRSNVVLMARVDDPIAGQTRATRSTIVAVEHSAGEPLTDVIDMAIEMAPDVKEWNRY